MNESRNSLPPAETPGLRVLLRESIRTNPVLWTLLYILGRYVLPVSIGAYFAARDIRQNEYIGTARRPPSYWHMSKIDILFSMPILGIVLVGLGVSFLVYGIQMLALKVDRWPARNLIIVCLILIFLGSLLIMNVVGKQMATV